MQRGEIWWAEIPEPINSAPGYRRPVLILQSDIYNRSRLQTIIAISLTSNMSLADMRDNVILPAKRTHLPKIRSPM